VELEQPLEQIGERKERGVFKTTDGGKTGNNVKFIDENTGWA
jgi:hypothetical protein